MENIMASKESMLFKFFEKWKQKRLNKFAKKTLKDNPGLEKHLRALDAEMDKIKVTLDKGK
jgi:hypothetical protein